jgi:hypothetical protein
MANAFDIPRKKRNGNTEQCAAASKKPAGYNAGEAAQLFQGGAFPSRLRREQYIT